MLQRMGIAFLSCILVGHASAAEKAAGEITTDEGVSIKFLQMKRIKGTAMADIEFEVTSNMALGHYDPNLKLGLTKTAIARGSSASGNFDSRLFAEREPVKSEWIEVKKWELRKFRVKVRVNHLIATVKEIAKLELYFNFIQPGLGRNERQARFYYPILAITP